MKTRTTKIAVGMIGLLLLLDWYILTRNVWSPARANADSLPVYSAQELGRYDGSEPGEPILLALDGYVYDVSAGARDFYGPSQSYHDLAGKDSSKLLHVFGGEIIKRKYRVVGVYKL